nr:MAG TPA: hypothetical protein [Bacteriophage sp.]
MLVLRCFRFPALLSAYVLSFHHVLCKILIA